MVAQPVTMFDTGAPRPYTTRPRPQVVVDPNVALQYVSAPAVMIPCNVNDFHTSLSDGRQRGEHPKTMPGNHALPLEPEVEQITIDHQCTRSIWKRREISLEQSFDRHRSHPQMQIGNNMTRCL